MTAPASWCPQCGPGVTVDEDGCCCACGCTAVGPGADQALALKAALDAEKLDHHATMKRWWAIAEERSRRIAKARKILRPLKNDAGRASSAYLALDWRAR